MNRPEEMSTKFEESLAQAMRHVDAPGGFRERILSQVEMPTARKPKLFVMPFRFPRWATGALAAALLAGVFGAGQIHARHEREKAARAQQQFEVAVQITNETLQDVRQQLRQAGIPLGE